jgi:hypothetical protein
MILFVHDWSTCNIVELKTHFENLIARIEVNSENTFHLSYLITLLALDMKLTCAPHGHQLSKSSILCFIGRSTTYVLNTCLKREFFHMMIFVNVCSTCSVVEIKTRYETCLQERSEWCILFSTS